MKSIRTKIVAYVIILLLAVCIGFAGLSYNSASKALLEQVEETLPQLAVQAAKVVEKTTEGELNTLKVIALDHIICDPVASWEDKLTILNEEAKRSEYIRIGIADMGGELKNNDGSE
nr:methyl-accepting chemotaxis protein [Bacillota bacterium]